jgi:hypothetical protein
VLQGEHFADAAFTPAKVFEDDRLLVAMPKDDVIGHALTAALIRVDAVVGPVLDELFHNRVGFFFKLSAVSGDVIGHGYLLLNDNILS